MKYNINKKIMILILMVISLILDLLLMFILYLSIDTKKYEYKIYNNSLIYELNKIIIVGDSRMWLINNSREKLNMPNNIIFDAESGAKINWLTIVGIPRLYEILKDTDKKYKYNVVFNLGVNDLNSDEKVEILAKRYFDEYKKIINSNKSISFYFLSVNPIEENTLQEKFDRENKRTNKKIEEFNNYFINRLSKENIENAKYCDSYNTLNFVLPDGLHYDSETNKKIINYIINNCIK